MSHLKLVHKLRNLNADACKNHAFKCQMRGAKNLDFYTAQNSKFKKAMTLPLLKILGHEIAKANWQDDTKLVTWSACLLGFFGSFRMGELLAKHTHSFNKFETLLWNDVQFFDDNSAQLHNKVPKTRKAKGEYISIFEFKDHNCCPITSLTQLRILRSNCEKIFPVFAFNNGSFLTKCSLNKVISEMLKPHLGEEAQLYSCKSFRAALPSALAALPCEGNEKFIKRWGRWDSNAFEKYIRLSHLAKRRIFEKFAIALNS